MKVWFKRVLVTLVVVVIVALIGLAIFLLTFDPNSYKSKFEEVVYNRYQRTLAIKGDIELSLFPRIGLSVQGVSLSDRDSTNIFASVDSARFAVAIWPLLSNRLVVDHVAVSGFKAWVIRNRDGKFNFQDLIENGPEPLGSNTAPAASLQGQNASIQAVSADTKASLLPAMLSTPPSERTDLQIDIAGLELKNGEIHVYDAISSSVGRLVNLQVNTGRMTVDQPFDVALSGKLVGDLPVADAKVEGNALVKVNPDRGTYSAQKLNVQMSGAVADLQAKTATLQGNLAYNANSNLLDVSNFELLLQGAVQGENPIKNLETSLSAPRLKIDRSRSELNVEKLSFRAKGALPEQTFDIAFDAPSLSVSPDAAKGDAVSGTVKLAGDKVLGVTLGLNGLGGNAQHLTLKELKIDGGLKQGDRLLQVNVSSPAEWNVNEKQGGLSAIKGDVKIEDKALPTGTFGFPLIGNVRADLVKDVVSSEFNAVINSNPLRFNLKATQLAEPRIVFDLQSDAIDFNNFFGPAAKPAPAAPAKSDAATTASPKPAPPAQASAPVAAKPAASIDLSMLDPLDLTGNIKIDALKVGGVEAKNFSVAVRSIKGTLTLSKMLADLYGGKLNGQLTANSKNAFTTQLALNGVSVGPLLHGLTGEDRLAGTGSVKLALKSQGSTAAALTSALTGTVDAQMRDGTIKGINLTQTLREAASVIQNVFSGQVPDMATKFDLGRQTEFSSMDAGIAFDQGQGNVKKLNIEAPLLRISAGKPASIDLVNEQLDVVANVRVVNAIKGDAGNGLDALLGVTVPVRISGPFEAPGYRVQWKEISSRAVKQAVEGGLLDLISNKVGKELIPEATAKETPAIPKKAVDPVKSIGDALKGLLGQ
ncbi:MAG TPA: AsmA family protein [Eoetvoesiella sp.]